MRRTFGTFGSKTKEPYYTGFLVAIGGCRNSVLRVRVNTMSLATYEQQRKGSQDSPGVILTYLNVQ